MVHSACITVLKLWMPAPFTWGLAKSLALPKSMSFTLPCACHDSTSDVGCIGMLEWDWNGIAIGMGLECWNGIDVRNWTSSVSTRISTESRHLEARWAHSQPSKWERLVTGDSEWHESLGKSLNPPFLLRFYERCFKSENFRFSSTFPCSWDSNFKSRWTIWASRRYWISVFRLFRVARVSYCQLLSVTVSLCLPYFRFALTKKIWDSFPVPSGHQMAVDAIQLLATSMIWAK